MVLPVDDDDWFSPDAGRVLSSELDPRAAGYRWPSSWIEPPRGIGPRLFGRRLLPWPAPTFTCTTNNYALVKEEGVRTPLLLSHHLLASQWFDREIEEPTGKSPKTINRRLSVANRTLASQTSLRFRKQSMSRAQLIRKFRRFQGLYDRPPAAGLELVPAPPGADVGADEGAGAPSARLVVGAGAVPDVELDRLDGELHQARRREPLEDRLERVAPR